MSLDAPDISGHRDALEETKEAPQKSSRETRVGKPTRSTLTRHRGISIEMSSAPEVRGFLDDSVACSGPAFGSEAQARRESQLEPRIASSRALSQDKSTNKSEPLQTSMELFLKNVAEFPVLTRTLERKFARLKDEAATVFQKQAKLLEQAVRQHCAGSHSSEETIAKTLEEIKNLIIRREIAISNDHLNARVETLSIPERDSLAHTAFRRMVQSSRYKGIFDPMIVKATDSTDDVLVRNIFAVIQEYSGLCKRVEALDAEEIGALASITRESFMRLRAALPDNNSCLKKLAEMDAKFAAKITDDAECMEYIEPLLRKRSLAGINLMTPQEILMRANLLLVVKIAKRFQCNGLDRFDIIEEGNLGLYKAILGFDFSRNVRLSTYASHWIKQSISRSMINHGSKIRISVSAITLVHKWEQTKNRLHAELGRSPNENEMQLELQCSARTLNTISRASKVLNAQFHHDGDAGDEDKMSIAPDQICRDDDRDLVATLLNKLNAREKEIILLRFPQDGSKPMTLAEIGKRLELSHERVRMIESRALLRMKKLVELIGNTSRKIREGIESVSGNGSAEKNDF